MKPRPDIQDSIRRYLLHDLDDEAQDEIEQHILADLAFREQLEIAQNELIDDFANGVLSEEDRARFESNFLTTPERVGKVQFARAIADYVSANPPRPSTAVESAPVSASRSTPFFLRAHWLKLAFAVLLVVAVLVAVRLLVLIRAPSPAVVVGSRRTPLEQELAVLNSLSAEQNAPGVFSRTLKPTVVRDVGDSRRLELPADSSVVRLRLEMLSADRRSYRATLETDEGHEIATIDSLPLTEAGGSRFVTLNLPVRLLPPGDYQVRLLGTDDERQPAEAGVYPFQVVNRR